MKWIPQKVSSRFLFRIDIHTNDLSHSCLHVEHNSHMHLGWVITPPPPKSHFVFAFVLLKVLYSENNFFRFTSILVTLVNGGLVNGGSTYLSTIVHDCLYLSSFCDDNSLYKVQIVVHELQRVALKLKPHLRCPIWTSWFDFLLFVTCGTSRLTSDQISSGRPQSAPLRILVALWPLAVESSIAVEDAVKQRFWMISSLSPRPTPQKRKCY